MSSSFEASLRELKAVVAGLSNAKSDLPFAAFVDCEFCTIHRVSDSPVSSFHHLPNLTIDVVNSATLRKEVLGFILVRKGVGFETYDRNLVSKRVGDLLKAAIQEIGPYTLSDNEDGGYGYETRLTGYEYSISNELFRGVERDHWNNHTEVGRMQTTPEKFTTRFALPMGASLSGGSVGEGTYDPSEDRAYFGSRRDRDNKLLTGIVDVAGNTFPFTVTHELADQITLADPATSPTYLKEIIYAMETSFPFLTGLVTLSNVKRVRG